MLTENKYFIDFAIMYSPCPNFVDPSKQGIIRAVRSPGTRCKIDRITPGPLLYESSTRQRSRQPDTRLFRIYSVKFNELIDFTWSYGVYSDDHADYLDPNPYICALDIKIYLFRGPAVLKFIEKYIEKIDACFGEDFRYLSMALLCFKQSTSSF